MIGGLQTYFSEIPRPYTGSELHSHFNLKTFQAKGSALCAFIGPCDVKTSALVDLEDQMEGEHIRAARMVHFIGEFFGLSLREGVLFQRVFVSIVKQWLEEQSGQRFTQKGNDLFNALGQKGSVSIVTVSPVSTLFHFGINSDGAGAPVPVFELQSLGISDRTFVKEILERVAIEWRQIEWACTKVRAVM